MLLLVFIAGIGANLARGRTPDCHCFGQLLSAPVGWSTLLRTGVLALVAGFVAWQGRTSAGPSVLSGLGAWPLAQGLGLIAGVLALALGAAEGWLLVQLVQQNGRLLARLEALEAHLGLGASGPALVSRCCSQSDAEHSQTGSPRALVGRRHDQEGPPWI